MPDLNAVTTLINTLGFPIVMVGYFIWDKTKTTNKLVEAINNNNTILAKLLTKLNSEELGEKDSAENE